MNYLLHFEQPLAHAQHYIGYCEEKNLNTRIEFHTSGRGSKLMKAVVNAGINFVIARVWPNQTREDERRLKNQKHASRFCPICKQKRTSC